ATYGQNLPKAVSERLQVASSELDRVSQIIRDYLDHTRAAKPTIEQAELRRVIEEAVRVTTSATRRTGVRIVIDVDPELNEVRTDPGLLRQVLINLLNNALDATQAARTQGGTPSSRIVVSARAATERGQVDLAVTDEGIGIAGDEMARIFEPFYTTKGRGRGTGLGLSICRELVRSLGGKIRVDSTPGKGSTFAVTLPRMAA
ncbi:MAG TPA: HAMP domain-containing sensor histidine kinase, partial [Pseudomonadota bacterium]|nr:HAMP domain-containing sensor histidine kinase [Pseudomonadota bacterium]